MSCEAVSVLGLRCLGDCAESRAALDLPKLQSGEQRPFGAPRRRGARVRALPAGLLFRAHGLACHLSHSLVDGANQAAPECAPLESSRLPRLHRAPAAAAATRVPCARTALGTAGLRCGLDHATAPNFR